jgi:flagellar basal body-associated protein FliL
MISKEKIMIGIVVVVIGMVATYLFVQCAEEHHMKQKKKQIVPMFLIIKKIGRENKLLAYNFNYLKISISLSAKWPLVQRSSGDNNLTCFFHKRFHNNYP